MVSILIERQEIAEDGISPICINEVSAANDIYMNDYGKRADWIELYKRGREPVDVSQWYFSDDENNSTKYQINASDEVNTIMKPNEHMVIWCDGKPSLTQIHLPFKLKNTDNNTMILQSSDGKWKDTIHYYRHSAKETVGRYPDGGDNFYTFYHPTIGNKNTDTSYDNTTNANSNVFLSPTQSNKIMNVNYYSINGTRILKPQNNIYIKDALYMNRKKQRRKIYIRLLVSAKKE